MSTASVTQVMGARTAARALDWSRLERWLCWGAIGFGILVRWYRFWEPSLWLDELGSAFVAQASGWDVLWQFCRFENHPPLYYLVLRPFLWLGHQEFFLRLPSLLFGLATIAVVMATLRRAAGSRAALYGGALLAVNSRAILHSQEARMYAAALFWSALSTYWFLRALDKPDRKSLAAYAISTLLAPYTQLLYVSVPAAQAALCWGWLLFYRRRPPAVARLLCTQALLVPLLVPLLPLVQAAASFRHMYASWMAKPGLEWLADTVTWPEFSFAVVLFPGLLFAWRRLASSLMPAERGLPALGFFYLAIGPGIFLLARFGVVNVLEPRYLLPFLLGWALLAGSLAQRTEEPLFRGGLCVYIVLVIALQGLIAKRFGPWVGIFPHQDWRAANAWIEKHCTRGDVVLLRSGLTHVTVLSPQDRRAQEYLANPLGSFYGNSQVPVFNLPWRAAEMTVGPYPGPDAADHTRRAGQVFVLVNPIRERWDWGAVDQWVRSADASKHVTDQQRFDALELRVYRNAAGASPDPRGR